MGFVKLIGFIICIASVVGDKKLHDYMTDEEIFQVFNSHRHAVPEYELGSIDHEQHKNGLRIKRSVDNQTVFFKAFGKNIELFLEPNDHVLYGSATPLYIASYSGGKIRYKNRLYPLLKSMRSYVDERNVAALTMHKDDSGRHHLNGLVGNNLQIRSLPSSVLGLIEKHNFLREPNKNYHAFIQLDNSIVNTAINYFDKIFNKDGQGGSSPVCTYLTLGKSYIEALFEQYGRYKNTEVYNRVYNTYKTVLQQCKDDPSSVGSNYYDIIKNIKNILTGKANWGDYDFPNVNKPDNDGYPEPPNDNAENSDVKDKNNDNFQDLPGENSSANKSESDYDDDYDEYPDKVTTKKPKTSTRPTTTRKPKVKDELTAYPQLLITMDYKTAKNFKSIEDIAIYQAAFWNSVDLRFRQFTNPRIRLNIAGVVVPQDERAASYMNYGSSSAIMSEMGRVFGNDEANFPSNSYDIVIGFLHTETLPGMSGAIGLAYVGGACKWGSRNVIVADQGGYGAVLPAAHEIGHSLGADHDGDRYCSNYQPGHIMHSTSSSYEDGSSIRWSKCSQQQIYDFLRSYQGKCLYNKPDVGLENPKLFPGKIMTRDEQCEKIFGSGWTAEKRYDSGTKDNCIHLKCSGRSQNGWIFNTVSNTRFSLPPDGTKCGNNMACLNGECVVASSFLRK